MTKGFCCNKKKIFELYYYLKICSQRKSIDYSLPSLINICVDLSYSNSDRILKLDVTQQHKQINKCINIT